MPEKPRWISHIGIGSLTVAVSISSVALAEEIPRELRSRLASAVERLGHERFSVRETARKLLVASGENALPVVVGAAADHGDIEVRYAARWIVGRIIQNVGVSRTTGLKTLLIGPDAFQMGSPANESERHDDELLHRVEITRPFLLGKFEVRQRQYRLVTGRRPSFFSPSGKGAEKIKSMDSREFPVEQVTWFDAIDFCIRLSEMDGLSPFYQLRVESRVDGAITAGRVDVLGGNGYRLPTEAEWEFACRAGSASAYSFGSGASGAPGNFKFLQRSHYGSRTTTKHLERTTECGSYPPNYWGLHDMHGNVGEWCWDVFEKDYYQRSPLKDPWGPSKGQHRVLRGGSWLISQSSCRSANRFWLPAGEQKYIAGFRVARTPKWPTND